MGATRGNRSLRFLDRYLGIPLLSLFALFPKRRALEPRSVRRIGILKTAAIGDTLLLSGPLQDIRHAYPVAELVLITGADNRGVAQLLPVAAAEHMVVSPHRLLAAVGMLRRAQLDVLVDFGSWPRFDALLAALSGAKFRVGFRTPGQARHFGFDVAIDHSRRVHELENYRKLVAAIGACGRSAPFVSPPRLLRLDRLPALPFAVFHPWSGGYRHEVKEWPVARWVELAQRLNGFHIVLSGGPAEGARNRAMAATIAEMGCSVSLAECSLLELADILAASAVVVGVNTGVTHLAALLGARTVSLEGPTPPSRWCPIGPRVRTVESILPGCGYLNLGFEYDGHRLDCMDGISVAAVHSAIQDLIDAP